jgi:hypothetical protein
MTFSTGSTADHAGNDTAPAGPPATEREEAMPLINDLIEDARCGADLELHLTGSETLGLALLVRRVLQHPDEFDEAETAAAQLLAWALEGEGFGY